jgi:hypothetical protein
MATRSFTIDASEVGATGGRFISASPYQAAAKAARGLFKDKKAAKMTAVRFTLRETTRAGDGGLYTYIGLKEKLDEPKIVERGDVKITIEHLYKVKACKE